MNQLLRTNEIVQTINPSINCRVEEFLGGGGQGEVYRATMEDGRKIALKWYFPKTATVEQRNGLLELIANGAPDDRFLWPEAIAEANGAEGFGYVMKLREEHYKSIVDLMRRRIEPTFRSLCRAGCQLADSFYKLHSQGMCYRDISFGNVFFDPTSGDILICDNDNVGYNSRERSGVLGTPRFMAPEVVRGDAHPSTESDLFSLSVLLFYMFMVHHPLDGAKEAEIKALDLFAMTKLYGTDPVFIFDPANDTNRPVAGLHDNATAFWPLYPEFLRTLFTQAFTKGIHDPLNGRVRESQWRTAMVRLADSIIECGSCGVENFYDVERLRSGQTSQKCWSCHNETTLPFRIRIGNNTIALSQTAEVCQHHIDGSAPDFSDVIAVVSKHPQDPAILGLTNKSHASWTYPQPDGTLAEVPPGKSVRLQTGLRINFGTADGEIR